MTLPIPLPGAKHVLDERRRAAAVKPLDEVADGPVCQPKTKFAAARLSWKETHRREADAIIGDKPNEEQIGLL